MFIFDKKKNQFSQRLNTRVRCCRLPWIIQQREEIWMSKEGGKKSYLIQKLHRFFGGFHFRGSLFDSKHKYLYYFSYTIIDLFFLFFYFFTFDRDTWLNLGPKLSASTSNFLVEMSWIEKLFHPAFKLANNRVILTPIDQGSFDKLKDISVSKFLWRYNPEFYCKTEEIFKQYMNRALEMQREKVRLPLLIYDMLAKRDVGSTSFYFINEEHRRISIGYTFIGQPFQKTGVNPNINFL